MRIGPDPPRGWWPAGPPALAQLQRASCGGKNEGRKKEGQDDDERPRHPRWDETYLERPRLVRGRCVVGVSGLCGGDRACAAFEARDLRACHRAHTWGVGMERNRQTRRRRRRQLVRLSYRHVSRARERNCLWAQPAYGSFDLERLRLVPGSRVVGVSVLYGGDRASAAPVGRDQRTCHRAHPWPCRAERDRQPRRCRRRDGKRHSDHVRGQRPKVDHLRFEPWRTNVPRGRGRLVGPCTLSVLAGLINTALIDRGYFEVVPGPAVQTGHRVAGAVGAAGQETLRRSWFRHTSCSR